MLRTPLLALITLLCLFPPLFYTEAEENFILLDLASHTILQEYGPAVNERMTPCSTFKIVLSVMGYDAGILKNESNPTWDFQDGYDDWLAVWKTPQTPSSWMKYSCVWYSRVLAQHLGLASFQHYLNKFDYGNQDASGGLTNAWINSSLTISPLEQATFIQKFLEGELPVSAHAIQMTKAIMYTETLPDGAKLFGKTGWSGSTKDAQGQVYEIGWFVGWLEKEHLYYPFAYAIRDQKIDLNQRIPRVKELINLSCKYNN